MERIRSRFSDYLFFLGPGLLLAVAAAGESGLSEVIASGAHFGFSLIWVIIITLVFKYAFTTGIARYTLATGETIFDGLRKVPGPKNWSAVFITVIYLLEMFAFAGMLLMGGIFLDYLIPGLNPPWLLSGISLVFILRLLWKESYERIEKIVVIIVIFLFGGIILSLSQFYINAPAIIEGAVPSIPPGSIITIMALMGSVGSGLNILLYSVWLHEKTGGEYGESYFKRYFRSVKLDLVLAFSLVGIITVIFIGLGVSGFVVSYLRHGEEVTTEAIISQVLYIVGALPYGIPVFLIFGYITMFGATLTGIDGRARAVSSMVKNTLGLKLKEELLYRVCLLVFSVIVLGSFFFFTDPSVLLRHASAIASIMFAVFGFIIIYLDRKLPKYSRGSRLWITVTAVGSIIFLYIALSLESGILEFGLPLVERLLLIGFVLFLLSKTEMFEKMLSYSLGGWTATACMAATIFAGFFAGVFAHYYRGEITYYRAVFLVVIVECAHVLVFVPLFVKDLTMEQFLWVIDASLLPMIFANVIGMIIFTYIIKITGRGLHDYWPFRKEAPVNDEPAGGHEDE